MVTAFGKKFTAIITISGSRGDAVSKVRDSPFLFSKVMEKVFVYTILESFNWVLRQPLSFDAIVSRNKLVKEYVRDNDSGNHTSQLRQ